MNKVQNLKVKYWKNGRYAIFNEDTGKIVDDAQGYGFKEKQKAIKAIQWKLGGKKKLESEKKLFNKWIKVESNKQLFNELNNIIEYNIKEIAFNDITINDIVKEIEKNRNVIIPKFVIKNLCK